MKAKAYPDTEKCDSCDALMINGVYCHETGCPKQMHTVSCFECGCDMQSKYRHRGQVCLDCQNPPEDE